MFPGSLHNHTDYSNLRLRDSINRYDELINYAIKLKHEVIAFTEHEAVSNAIKIENYYNKIKKNNPNFKVILGNEIYLCRDNLNSENYVAGEDKFYHFILLAKDAIGHQQIRELSTRAWNRSWMQGKMRRVPTYYQDLIDIIGTNPGHVIGSTACLGGFLPTKLLQYCETQDNELYNKIKKWCLSIQNIFGKKDFYLEMQPSFNEEQIVVNKLLKKLSNELSIKYIITTDSHYLNKEDASIHKAYLNSQEGDREVDEFYSATYMMSTEELENYMNNYFNKEDFKKAYDAIKEIKNKCQDYSLKKSLKIPVLKWKIPSECKFPEKWKSAIPYLNTFLNSNFEGDRILAKAIMERVEQDETLQNKETYEAIEQNLDATWISSNVNKVHWSSYFLNLQNIIENCWSLGTIIGPGRGSGVGFILLYILGITQINPLRETTKTFSWRFLNPERVSVLDVDVDIEGSKREQILSGLKKYYGEDRVANVATFGTEAPKLSIQTAARGLDIDNDQALYWSSLIPSDRGKVRSLKECYYGNKEKGFAPVATFVREMNENPKVWKMAQRIEGLVCKMGEHAGGVIFVDEPFTNSTALLRTPKGHIATQFDLHDCEDVSLIKYDLLSVEGLDKIHKCLDLLIEDKLIKKEPTLKETYEKVIGIYNLEREDEKMWQMIWEHKIQALFQMEQQSGIQGIAIAKPKSVNDLSVLNSVIRLMAPEKNAEQPLQTWARYRKDINQWYNEMRKYGLTEDEIDWLSHHNAVTDGLCESQEGLMSLVQEERLGGNSLTFADKCRKGVAKKVGTLFEECEQEYYKNIKEKGCSEKLAHYVWDILLRVQRGYSFNRSHCLAYSLIALQEMNLCYKYPIIYWNCACLQTDSGDIGSGSNYDKIAGAIGKMTDAGIKISLPNINNSGFEFKPDIKNNQIMFGLKGVTNVGDDIIFKIIENRPYISPKDFVQKINPNKQIMVNLIKSGCFDNLIERKICMGWYLWQVCDKKSNLTLANMRMLLTENFVPTEKEEFKIAARIFEFNRFLKTVKKSFSHFGDYCVLNDRAVDFLIEIKCENLIEEYNNEYLVINMKSWDKFYQIEMNIFRDWINNNKKELLNKINSQAFLKEWKKYAEGSYSKWEIDSVCYYSHPHELINVNYEKYGLSDYSKLPKDPEISRSFYKNNKTINLYKLYKICGTCIAKNKNKSLVTLLTPEGITTVKFPKNYFSLFDKQISEMQADGKKKIVEKSWFNRGNMIIVQGYRSGDSFIPKKYASVGGHQLYKIDKVLDNGDINLRTERYKGGITDE